MPVGGGEETKVGDWNDCLFWERGAYCLTPPDKQGSVDICFHDFSTGETKKILTIEFPKARCFAVSPDGRTILYTQVDEAGSDLMLVENFR